MPKFIDNNYENFLLNGKFARNFVNLRSTIYVKGHSNKKGLEH